MLERPFEPGDWIQMGDLTGQVQEVSWRAVRLKLIRQEDYLIVPNSVVAKSEIVNMSQPLPIHGHAIEVSAPCAEPPGRVREVLIEAALDVAGVLRQPPPRARVERLSKTLARRQAERDDAIHRAAVSEYEGPGADRASQLLGRMRRFFGLMGGDSGARG